MAERSAALGWPAIFALTTAIGLLQALAVLNPALVERDPEEMYNAGHGWLLLHGHLDALWRLQYRDFCGGCTLDAALGAAVFSLLPRSWLAWKLVPIGFTALLTAVGLRRLSEGGDRIGPATWAALMALPPAAALHLSLIAWGNHVEAGALGAMAALVLLGPGRPGTAALAGLLAGLATWVSFSGAPALVATLCLSVARRQPRLLVPTLVGIGLGLSPWLGQWLTAHTQPFVTIYEPGEALPSLARLPHKLATLFSPGQLVALFGLPYAPGGWLLGWGAAASILGGLLLALQRPPLRVPLAFLGAWLATYSLVRFQIYDPPWPEIAGPGSLRYAAPIYPLIALLLALGTAGLRSSAARALLIGPVLLSGATARLEALRGPFPTVSVARMDPVDLESLRLQVSYLLRDEEHAACRSVDPRSQALHAYALGRNSLSHRLLADRGASLAGLQPREPDQAWAEGVGEALIEQLDGDEAGGVDALAAAEARLETLDLDTQPLIEPALRAAAARRAGARADWTLALQRHDERALIELSRLLEARSPRLRRAVAWAAGRRYASDITAFAQPKSLEVPSVPTAIAPAFWEGFGFGLGEEWGPTSDPSAVSAPDEGSRAALRAGWEEGQARRWLDP